MSSRRSRNALCLVSIGVLILTLRLHLVNDVVEWTVSYVENHLNDWISDHGGWAGFLNFFQNQDEVDGGGWLNPRRVLGYAAGLVGVLTIGAFLGQRA